MEHTSSKNYKPQQIKDEAYSFEFTNKKIEVPQTGDIGNKKFILGTLLLALLGLALIVIRVYKDSKKDK